MREGRHSKTLIRFREQLDELQNRLLEMAGLVESAIHQSIVALVHRDEAAAKDVFWKEALINQKDLEIDEFATRLLALYQPMAGDMRYLTAAIKINGDLERMGDLAVNITHRALSLMRHAPVNPLIDIPRMAGLVENMVRRSLDALAHGDEELARTVLISDDEVDFLKELVSRELITCRCCGGGTFRRAFPRLRSGIRNVSSRASVRQIRSRDGYEDARLYTPGGDGDRG